ncbi:Uncharacterised protein [Bordetella pertussis]|nr:Uncharacterised protein [Bordetella pertussis]CFU08840.1 Uncharacterised protein [Bordetella pertussis]CPJ85574.1 Uncharacterised protein [Bordetella pertussis]CPO96845.1 Uncharacterised protein [Bordetella pertussis]
MVTGVTRGSRPETRSTGVSATVMARVMPVRSMTSSATSSARMMR